MVAIEVTSEEIAGGRMAPEHLKRAVDAVRTEGFVVLKGVIDVAHLEVLRERMLEDIDALKRREDAPFNWHTGNLQQDAPPFPPYLFRDVLVNAMVVEVTRAVLGPGVKNAYYSGNTALPSRERQPVHADTGHLWPELEVAHPAAALVVNVPVVGMNPENGSTEIWPGTHRDLTIAAGKDIKVPQEVVERRRKVVPPIQPCMDAGDVLIRDIRLWHAGMPNLTDKPRPMIAMIHYPRWMETGTPLVFPKGTEEFFEGSELRTCARFVEGQIDYIRAPQAYEYQPA